MAKVLIYGASDDLIEVEGDITDEFGAYDKWKYVHFDDGTVVKAGYALVPDKGWSIEVVKLGDGAATEVLEPTMDDGQHYTDRLSLTGNFTSCQCYSSPEGPTREEMIEALADMDWRCLKDADLRPVFAAAVKAGLKTC
jgi:hypothetical protein